MKPPEENIADTLQDTGWEKKHWRGSQTTNRTVTNRDAASERASTQQKKNPQKAEAATTRQAMLPAEHVARKSAPEYIRN